MNDEKTPADSDQDGATSAKPPAGFGKGVNDYLNHYITLTDGKAGAIIAASGGAVALLLDGESRPAGLIANLTMFGAVALFSLAIGFGAWVIYPRLPSARRGVVFWEDIRSHTSVDDYHASVKGLGLNDVELEYAAQNYFVSSVLHAKMAATQKAIGAFLAAVILAIILGLSV